MTECAGDFGTVEPKTDQPAPTAKPKAKAKAKPAATAS